MSNTLKGVLPSPDPKHESLPKADAKYVSHWIDRLTKLRRPARWMRFGDTKPQGKKIGSNTRKSQVKTKMVWKFHGLPSKIITHSLGIESSFLEKHRLIRRVNHKP